VGKTSTKAIFVSIRFVFSISFTVKNRFLVACTRLYKPLCGRSVGRFVRWSVCRSVPYCENKANRRNKTIWAMETISNDSASAWCCVYSIVTAPVQPHATKPPVYTALFVIKLILNVFKRNIQSVGFCLLKKDFRRYKLNQWLTYEDKTPFALPRWDEFSAYSIAYFSLWILLSIKSMVHQRISYVEVQLSSKGKYDYLISVMSANALE